MINKTFTLQNKDTFDIYFGQPCQIIVNLIDKNMKQVEFAPIDPRNEQELKRDQLIQDLISRNVFSDWKAAEQFILNIKNQKSISDYVTITLKEKYGETVALIMFALLQILGLIELDKLNEEEKILLNEIDNVPIGRVEFLEEEKEEIIDTFGVKEEEEKEIELKETPIVDKNQYNLIKPGIITIRFMYRYIYNEEETLQERAIYTYKFKNNYILSYEAPVKTYTMSSLRPIGMVIVKPPALYSYIDCHIKYDDEEYPFILPTYDMTTHFLGNSIYITNIRMATLSEKTDMIRLENAAKASFKKQRNKMQSKNKNKFTKKDADINETERY